MNDRWTDMSEAVRDFYSSVGELPVAPSGGSMGTRAHLDETYGAFTDPRPSRQVQADVLRMLREEQVHATHPRYFGLFNPSVFPAAVVADALVAVTNPQVCVYSHAPGANEIERHTLRYLARKLGCDPERWFAGFTSGGSEANQSAVIAALTRDIHGFAEHGLAGGTAKPTLYLSAEGHHSFDKIVHGVGMGRGALRRIPVTDRLTMDVEALASAMAQDRERGYTPSIVVATAGTTGAGVADPLRDIASLCRERSVWFHVDAAWGGAACLSPKLRTEISGIELADSITWDAHKWLSVPMGAGMFFCRHPEVVRRAFAVESGYMPASTPDVEEPYLSSILWSRRFIGLKVFMALAELGEEGYRHAIERQAEICDLLRSRLSASGWKLLNDTLLPVVCFTGPSLLEGRHRAEEVVAGAIESGVWISEVKLANHDPALRACITSFRSTSGDVDALVEALAPYV
ncbi:MAG: pyridoxal-dependent decarboxylase [Myxococcota bacterium]